MARNGSKRAYIGIDIGGTKSLFALFDEKFEVLAEKKFRTHPEKGGAKAFSRKLDDAVREMLEEAREGGFAVKVVGVGCAGDIDMKEGIVRSSPNLGFLKDYPFRRKLERLTRARVFVGHDVQSGLYGEFKLGAARKARHVIGVWIGTGVGGAMIVDGRLHLGARGLAGDIGNYLLHAVDIGAEAPPQKEVLDAVASRTAIAGDAAALAARHKAPTLRKVAGTDVTDIRSRDLAEAIRKGDKAVEKLVRGRAAVIGAALSNLVDFINPDIIVLGGGLVEAMGSLVRSEVRKSIDAHAAPKAAKSVRVVTARLHSHAVTVGAARLAVDMFSGRPPIDLDAM